MNVDLSVRTTGSENRKAGAPRFRLTPTSIVEIDGIQSILERRLQDAWWFLTCETREPFSKTDLELAELQRAGRFFLVWEPMQRNVAPPREPLNVGPEAHTENLRKLEYVLKSIGHPDYRRSRSALRPIIEEIAERRGETPPSFTTVLGWIDRYNRHGESYGPAALATRHDKKGYYGKRLAEYQEQAIEVGLTVWLRGNTKSNAYASVCDHIRKCEENETVNKAALHPKHLTPSNELKRPSLRAFERRCEEVDPRIRDTMRIGARYARQHGRTYSTIALPSVPYAEVEVDHCTLDVLLLHQSGTVLGRPDLLIFKDRATGLVAGYGLGFDQPSYASFVSGLRHTIYPKDTSQFPKVTSAWPCFGRPQNLITDRGMHFIGGNIEEAAKQLGINLIQLPGRRPWLKGAIERFFRSLNIGLIHQLSGTTLANIVERRDRENLGSATLTLDQFEGLLVYWICEIYNKSPARALGLIRGMPGKSPLEAWQEKAESMVTGLVPKEQVFTALVGDVEYRTLQKNGFVVDYIVYEDANLARILASPKHKTRRRNGVATKYKVTRDPHDIGRIYVSNHHTGEVLTVSACAAHYAYADGLTLTEHQIICAHSRRRFGKGNDFSDLMRAKAELNEFSAAIKSSPAFKTVQRRWARWDEGDRVRKIRSQIESFEADGSDYLQPIDVESTPLKPSWPLNESEQGGTAYDPGELEPSIEDYRRNKPNWESSYD